VTQPPAPRRTAPTPTSPRSLRRAWAARLALAAFAALVGLAAAAGFVALDLGQRLAATRDAAVGVVTDVDVEVRDGEPWTLVTLDVERWWRRAGVTLPAGGDDGTNPGTLTAAFWGGRAPGVDALQVAGMPTFLAGERVIWWLRAADEGLAAPTVGVTQGVWREVEGRWQGDDGSLLGLDDRGALALQGEGASDEALFDAIEAAFAAGGAP
jgi:hypothetical protein